MSRPLNKTIAITHEGEGYVSFPVPCLSPNSEGHLTLQCQARQRPSGENVGSSMLGEMEPPLFLKLLKMGGNLQNLFKKRVLDAQGKGSFYAELLQEGFLQEGAISLIGLMPTAPLPSSGLPPESKRVFKAVIQLDGDMICQIDRSILKEKRADELIQGYIAVQHLFFEEFRKVLYSIRLLITVGFSVLIPCLYLLWKLIRWMG